jgi:hypothetical protein
MKRGTTTSYAVLLRAGFRFVPIYCYLRSALWFEQPLGFLSRVRRNTLALHAQKRSTEVDTLSRCGNCFSTCSRIGVLISAPFR